VEFDVSIQGISEDSAATVRFVVENHRGYDVCIVCEHTADNKFRAKIPALDIEESEQPYRVEVIVDGYYFSPSRGNMRVAKAPRVQMEQTSVPAIPMRPQVTTSLISQPRALKRSWVKLSEMSDRQQSDLASRCQRSAKVLQTAAGLLAQIGGGTNVEPQALSKVFETVRNACDIVEKSIVRTV
jgi:hypothetical protein